MNKETELSGSVVNGKTAGSQKLNSWSRQVKIKPLLCGLFWYMCKYLLAIVILLYEIPDISTYTVKAFLGFM